MDKFRRYGIIIAILVIVGCGVVAFWTIFNDGGSVVTPQLVGMSCQEASEALEKLELSAKINKVDSMEPADTVVSQNVKPGTKLNPGDSLVLEISRGGKLTKIPDVRLLKQEEAVRRLEENGFRISKTISVSDESHDFGTVLAQNPSAGQKIDAGCGVELLVCGGGSGDAGGMVYIPDLRGKTAEQAEAALQKAGLVAGEKTAVQSASKEGTVVSTKPNIGSRVSAGTEVELRIAQASVPKAEVAKAQEDNTQETKKEHIVKAVKVEESKQQKITVKNEEQKATAKKTDAKIAEKKAETKQEATKADISAKAKEAKAQDKKETKTENKKAAAEQPKKAAETKADETKPEKKAETKPAEKTETKTEQKKETEQKPSAATKSAKVRYIVPPLTSPMSLKITMRDAEGTHVLKDISAQGNEVINMPVKYAEKATVTILLGGETVWQENYK